MVGASASSDDRGVSAERREAGRLLGIGRTSRYLLILWKMMFGSVVPVSTTTVRLDERAVERVAFVTDRQVHRRAVRTGEHGIRKDQLVAFEQARAAGKRSSASAQGDHAVGRSELAAPIPGAGDGAERIAAIHGVDALP
jgi:hypothetical protein